MFGMVNGVAPLIDVTRIRSAETIMLLPHKCLIVPQIFVGHSARYLSGNIARQWNIFVAVIRAF
jgi:hypothetical protein